MADLAWSSLWKVGFSEKFGFTNYKLIKTNKHGIVIDVLFNNKPSKITTFYRTTPKKLLAARDYTNLQNTIISFGHVDL